MPFWQRLLFTIIVIVVASFIAGLIWHRLFGFSLPSYVGGVIGGLTAVPFWELLKRRSPRKINQIARRGSITEYKPMPAYG